MNLKKIPVLLVLLGLSAMLSAQSVLDNILSPSRLPYLKKSKMIQISSYDRSGGNNDRINLKIGETATIAEMEGPGVITRIWITIDSRDPYFLRRIVLRMFWDGEENPSVEVPVGDFFGTGFRYKQYMSAFVGMTSGGYYCYFPMPFRKSARIEVQNQTGQEIYAFYYHIDYQKLEQPLEDDVAYFHAQWRRDLRTSPKKNYTVLEAEGEGHFVGLNMSMQNYRRSLWYLEGDEMVYVDGEKFPSIYGTGTEDYFTSGWYFNTGEFAAPYHGLIIKNDSLARIAAYRFQVGDAIPFKKSIKFTIEHGHANEVAADYSSTAYWYQKEPHKPFPPLLKPSLRIPLRFTFPENVIKMNAVQVKGSELKPSYRDASDYGPEWYGLQEVIVGGRKPISVKIPAATGEFWDLTVLYTPGQDKADADILVNGKKAAELKGAREGKFPLGKATLEKLVSRDGFIRLDFDLKPDPMKDVIPQIALVGFALEPVREYIPEWYVIGPFPNPRKSETERLGLDAVYPPEREIDLQKQYVGAEGQKVGWKKYQTPENGYFRLWDKVKPYEHVVTYALTYVYSSRDQTLPLMLGSDDGVKVFLNNRQLHRFLGVRIAAPDQDRVPLPLKKGWNKLLLKIENNFGGYAFYARIPDTSNSLIFSTEKKK